MVSTMGRASRLYIFRAIQTVMDLQTIILDYVHEAEERLMKECRIKIQKSYFAAGILFLQVDDDDFFFNRLIEQKYGYGLNSLMNEIRLLFCIQVIAVGQWESNFSPSELFQR